MPRYGSADSTRSSSVDVSFSSDKENHAGKGDRRVSSGTKNNALSATSMSSNGSANKRRRTGLSSREEQSAQTHTTMQPSQIAYKKTLERVEDKQFYDPEQSMAERRAVRKGIRDLSRELADSRNEYLASESKGLVDTLNRANDLFSNVKQTSDATLDSRLLVQAGDLSARRSAQMKLGGLAAGINVDEFVSRTIAFMRRGPSEAEATSIYPPNSTQAAATTSRRRRSAHRGGDNSDVDSDEAEADEGDAMNWEWLGRKAAFPHNLRPPVPAFLLGPLSVQKKVRKVTQRTARQQLNPEDAVRPDELHVNEIERAENSDLTALCKMIMGLLVQTVNEGVAAVEAEANDDMSEEEVQALMEKHGVADDGGANLFYFAFNPTSFGQTVENLFYICFLIRDGRVGVGADNRGITTLHPAEPSSTAQVREQGLAKNQGVFHLDFEIWEAMIEAFGIEKSIIPHRRADRAKENMKGWYG